MPLQQSVERMIDRLREAAEALNQGDPGPFAALMAKDSEWRGVSHGHLWWKRRPVCQGPAEALRVLKFQMEVRPEFTQVGDDRIIGSTERMGADGSRHERYQVLSLCDGQIVGMAGCNSRRQAERFARRY